MSSISVDDVRDSILKVLANALNPAISFNVTDNNGVAAEVSWS